MYSKLSATQIPLFQFKDEKTGFHSFWHLLQTSTLKVLALNAFFHSFKVKLKIFLTGASFQHCLMDNKLTLLLYVSFFFVLEAKAFKETQETSLSDSVQAVVFKQHNNTKLIVSVQICKKNAVV